MKIVVKLLLFLFVSTTTLAQVSSNSELTYTFNTNHIPFALTVTDGAKIINVHYFKNIMIDKNLFNLCIVNYKDIK